MEQQIIQIDKRLTRVEDKVVDVEKKVETLDTKFETGHKETEQDIKQLTVVLEKFIATQTKTNENIENLVTEMKTTREKQDEKFSDKIDKIENKFNEEIKTLQEEMLKNKYESVLGDKNQDLSNAKEKTSLSWKTIGIIVGVITFLVTTTIAIIDLVIN